MNMQAMLKQAQNLQKEMMKSQEAITNMTFEAKNGLVSVVMKGNKKLDKVLIDSEDFASDDLEMLQDMIVVAVNEALAKIEKTTEEKMGKYTKGIPGLF